MMKPNKITGSSHERAIAEMDTGAEIDGGRNGRSSE